MKKNKIALALGIGASASTSLLAATSSERYAYDASGNIVEKQIGDQVTKFDYDGNGLKRSLGTDGKQYHYDFAGRLVGESQNGRVSRAMEYGFSNKVTKVASGEELTELFYNAEGQLVGTSSSAKLEIFTWDGLALVSRGDEVYAAEAHQIGGVPVMIDDKVAVIDMTGTTLSIGDRSFHGSAFGEGMEQGLFSGRPFVEGANAFVFKYRNYSPTESRWTAQDPSGYPDGSNNFQYVGSDPVNNVDPEGLEWIPCEEPDGPGPKGSDTPSQNYSDRGTFSSHTFSHQWVFDSWHEQGAEATGGCGKALSGTHIVTESKSQKYELGVEFDLLTDFQVKGSSSTTAGSSVSIRLDYKAEATEGIAWHVKLGQAQGTVTKYKQAFKFVGRGRNKRRMAVDDPTAAGTDAGVIMVQSVTNLWFKKEC